MPEKQGKDWVIDVSDWLMKEIREWNTAVRLGLLSHQYETMSRVIKAWPFEGTPSAETFDKMSPRDYRDCMERVSQAAAEHFQA